MALQFTSPLWLQYVKHILKWEGKTSKDPRDTAVSCAPFAGAFHTNKGITYCTFKSLAGGLGITPVNYERFLKITDEEVGRFAHRYYQSVRGDKFNDSLALAMTEAAWGSGPARAYKHLTDALKDIGQRITPSSTYTAEIGQVANQVNQATLWKAYQNRRKIYLIDYLGNSPKYSMFKKGWNNRLNDFNAKFTPSASTGGAGIIAALLALFGLNN